MSNEGWTRCFGRNSAFLHPRTWEKSNLKGLPRAEKNSGITGFFVKYYALISNGGFTHDPIFILADDRMGEAEIDAHAIPGLGTTTAPGNRGWLVFCKRRVPPNDFYKWFLLNHLIPFANAIRENYGLDGFSLMERDHK